MARRGRATREVVEALKEPKARPNRRSGKLIEPAFLLLLKENPSHGYDLLNKMNNMGIIEDPVDAGTVYRILRDMEEDELVSSKWDTEGPGPAKRVYEIAPKANAEMGKWVEVIGKEIGLLEAFLKRLKEFTPETPN